MDKIESESKFIWKLLFHIAITPITLILVLFGKRETKDLFRPFTDIVEFIFGPKLTISIIAINVAIFFFGIFYISDEAFGRFVNYPDDLIGLRLHTLVTTGFLHGDLSHLFWNMLGIFIFGRVVERKLGPLRTSFVYFGALIISNLFTSLIHLLILNDNIGVFGASGALMGLVATAILIDPFYITYELILPLPIMVDGWLALYADISGIINPIEDGIGHLAHIGGFVSVGLIVFFMGFDERSKLKRGLAINIISAIIAIIFYYIFA